MGPSEKLDSGRFCGGRSNFSQTCSLLSQYLKENGSFGELTLGLNPNLSESKGTVNVLPMIEKSGRVDPTAGDGNKPGQMTIFYAGQVVVFDDFPAEKAKEIMMLAGKSSAPAFAPPQKAAESAERAHHALSSDLPIARKHSLARFLEKRKDRITANAPYQATKPEPAPLKRVKTEPWLGLASQLPVQIQRH